MKNSLIRRLPTRLVAKITNPPKAGGGVHQWLFTMSLQLHGHLAADEIVKVLTSAVVHCGRPVDGREIRDAVNAASEVKKAGRIGARVSTNNTQSSEVSFSGKPKWPAVNTHERERIISASPIPEAVLGIMSPHLIEGKSPPMKWFLQQMFTPGSLLCVGESSRVFVTRPLERLLCSDLRTTEFIVPSPMSASYGITKQGKRSMHTLSNTGQRMYLVTEFDNGTADEQSALIWHLRNFAPLVMVLRSGGKSLHAWWACAGVDEAKVMKFFQYAVSLGADPATWTRSQFVRVPQGWRADKQARQQVLYFDPTRLPLEGGAA